ncbi:MAG TPA: hypothetical protein VFF11_01050, partial [Candidatus Binatia bacterium]|nr:hypothetical protein [Candidatus Binatia bacterium]
RKTRMAISLRLATSNFLWRSGWVMEFIICATDKTPEQGAQINLRNKNKHEAPHFAGRFCLAKASAHG